MAEARTQFDDVLAKYRANQLDRRTLLRRAGALGISAATLGTLVGGQRTAAQDAPAGEGLAYQSISREDFKARLYEQFPLPENPTPGGTLIEGDIADISTTNLAISGDSPTNPVMNQIQEALINSDPVTGDYVPGLADSFTLAEDGITWTFVLHEGVTFHDGEPFTAEDVILSMDAQANPDTGSSYTGSFVGAVGSYRAIDDLTVEITATDVLAPVAFLGDAYVPVVPAHLWADVPFSQWASDPGSTGEAPERVVGTGPFRFVSFNPGEQFEMTRNEDYWDDVPYIENYIHQVWPDETSAIEALRAGDIDLIASVGPADVESLRNPEGGTDVKQYESYGFNWYAYNMDPAKTPLFQEREVRQALFLALDRQSLVDNVYLGFAEVAHGSQPVLSVAYDPEAVTTRYDYNPERAVELLEQAGWTVGEDGVRAKDGQRLAFEVMYTGGIPAYEQVVPAMQQYWADIQVEMTPNPVDFTAVLNPALQTTFDYQVVLLGFTWSYSGDQAPMFASQSYGVGFNAMRYNNPEVDRLFAEAARELDPEARIEALQRANNLVNEDLPVGVLWFRDTVDAFSTRVQNYNPNAYGGHLWPLSYVYLEEV